ncbi:MAG: hypothetical protein GY842_11210, partial [bacterium]|nr:hypothetical protein [bacterium]
TTDPRAGHFLRRLTTTQASRVLITTRLFPAVLEGPSDLPVHGVSRFDLPGLSADDGMALWRDFKVSGTRDGLLPMFRTFENHPLLIQALAARVAHDRQHPRDFDAWRAANPDFNPFSLDLIQVKAHILEVALKGLSDREAYVLHVIAAFRMPAGWDTLSALLIGDEPRQYPDPAGLISALSDLEDRGLLGWDNRPGFNRYDLHPIVRGVTWTRVPAADQQTIYGTLQVHFESMPMVEDWKEVESLEDLTPAIELYDKLIGLQRYDDARDIFRNRLNRATLYRLSASRQRVELLERLFPDGTDAPPPLSSARDQAWTLNALALAHDLSGQPGAAVPVFRLASGIYRSEDEESGLSINLSDLSDAFRLSGGLRLAETSAREALIICRNRDDRFQEGMSLQWLGLALAARGVKGNAALRRSLRVLTAQYNSQGEGLVNAYLGDVALWNADPATARPLADRAWELAEAYRLEADFIRAARLQGTAALLLAGPANVETADERLHHALTRARACNRVEEELPTLVALAELHRRRDDPKTARDLLDDLWHPAERGPYPMFHADALNLLAQIERDADNHDAAVAAATKAYQLSWCDGPPFAYHWGLQAAKRHLTQLAAPEPSLPPFNESNFDPIPQVEINPPDEFAE